MKQFFRYIFVGTLALIPLFIVVQLIFWVNDLILRLFNFISSYTNSGSYTAAVFAITLIVLAFIGSSIEKAGKSFVVSLIDKILDKQ